MSEPLSDKHDTEKHHLIYTYGTLKKGFPNHYLLQDLILKNDALFMGTCMTVDKYPLVLGLYGVPYMIHMPGSGHRVKGELYGVSARGLARLDELEGLSVEHYERRRVRVVVGPEEDDVAAEAYFAHGGYGEALWRRRGEVGMEEYVVEKGLEYVKVVDRAKDKTIVEELFEFVGMDHD